MNLRSCSIGFFLCSFLFSFSQEQVPKFGNGIFNLVDKDSTWSMKISARVQFLTSINWSETQNEGWGDARSNFLIRRARLTMEGFALTPKLTYKIQLGFSNRDMLVANEYTGNTPGIVRDAVLMWNFYDNFELWVGQAKLPGNSERLISSGALQFVDRSSHNAQFNIDRDFGFQLHHHFNVADNFLIREKLAFSQGEGRNVISGNLGGYQYTAKIGIFPFGDFTLEDPTYEKMPKFMISGAYNLNNNAVKTRGTVGSYMINDTGLYRTNINSLFLDAMFKYKGISFLGSYAQRDAKDPIAKNSDGSPTGTVVQVGEGFNFQAGYLFPGNWEVAARYTHLKWSFDQESSLPESQYTLGVSKYVVGHNLKIQSDLNYLTNTNSVRELFCRLQIQVLF